MARLDQNTGAFNGSVPQNICSSGQFLLAGRFWKNNMSLQGKCCWKKDNSGCPRGWFDVSKRCFVAFVRNPHLLPPPPPPIPHWRSEFCPMTTRKVASNVWIRHLLGNFPDVWLQFVGAPCWLRTLQSVLLGMRNRKTFPAISPNA